MSGIPTPKNSVGNAIKVYMFPALVTILASLIWRDVTEMRADVKALLAQSNIDKTDIQNLKRDVQMLDQAVFGKKLMASNIFFPFDRLFKHEEIFDLKKHLNMQ